MTSHAGHLEGAVVGRSKVAGSEALARIIEQAITD
jgi:hypothetical protein